MNELSRQSRTEWFTRFSERVGIVAPTPHELMTEVKIDDAQFKEIKDAVTRFIRAPLEGQEDLTSDQDLLETARQQLANLTPNGIVVPKQEIEPEFNQVQSSVVSWVKSLGVDDMLGTAFCLVAVRLVSGTIGSNELSRGYSSLKLHSEVWNGEPLDMIGIHIPISGDLENTTVEFFQPPTDFEDKYFYLLDDYDQAKDLENDCQMYPAPLKFGHAYFVDVIVPHKTVKNNGGARSIVQVELRRLTPSSDSNDAEVFCTPEHLSDYVGREDWYEYGTSKWLEFKDTYAAAKNGIFSKSRYGAPLFDLVTR